jgi:hypothetical protein
MVLAIPGGGILKKSFHLFLPSSSGGDGTPDSEERKEEQ